MSIGVVVTKIMTFFQKCMQVCRSCDLRSVGGTVGSRPNTSRLAGWLAAAAWAATVTSQACRNLIGPCVFNNVGRWPERAGCSSKSAAKSGCSGPTGRNSLSYIIFIYKMKYQPVGRPKMSIHPRYPLGCGTWRKLSLADTPLHGTAFLRWTVTSQLCQNTYSKRQRWKKRRRLFTARYQKRRVICATSYYDNPLPRLSNNRIRCAPEVFDIRALWRSELMVRVPGCQKLQKTA